MDPFGTIDSVSQMIRSGAVSSAELCELMIDRIDRYDRHLQSYECVMIDSARVEAQRADDEISGGQWRGPLHGIPIGIKDLYGTHDAPTSFGSKHLKDRYISHDAEVVKNLRDEGAVILGKLRMSEAALTDHGVDMPTPKNPWDENTWVGTSSSGCASATSAALCYGSLGSDTGGSIRGPATATGLTGLKPTNGLVSSRGTVALSPTLDTLGPIARSARDCRILFEAMKPNNTSKPEKRDGWKIGFDPDLFQSVSSEIREMLRRTGQEIESLGIDLVPVTLPDGMSLARNWVKFVGHEAKQYLRELYPENTSGLFGNEIAFVLSEGKAVSSHDLSVIEKQAADYRTALDAILNKVDAVLMPTISTAAPSIENIRHMRQKYERWNFEIMRLTCPTNFSAHPALAFPTGLTSKGSPLGAQLIGEHYGEHRLLEIIESFQEHTNHHSQHPQF